ncbi:MAG: hypothetical protein ACFFDK_09115 [Promethearchaeota archaeon]
MSERDKKIKILDEIDSMRVVQNNHFMIGEFKDAIKVAENIIDLAKEAKLDFIIKEQEDFINQMKKEKAKKDKISLTMEAFEKTRKKIENLLKNNDIVTAHKEVNNFKQKYSKITNLSSIPSVQELFLKDRELWINFMEEQENIKQELSNFSNKFLKTLKEKDFIGANKILEEVTPYTSRLLDEEIKKSWESHRQEYVKQKENYELCEKVEKAINESLSLKESFIFEEALLKIDSMGEFIKDKQLIQCKNRLMETRQEIVAAEIKYNKFYLELAKFKDEFRYNREHNFLFALSRVCEKIIHISQLIGMDEVEQEYKSSLQKIKNEIEEQESKSRLEQEELMERLKEIQNLIEIDEYVLPLVENFSIKDLLGDLSENIKEKLEQISTLLIENRVDIKKEIINKVILKTSSEEIVESVIPREILITDEADKTLTYNVRSGLTNRFEDIIDEAIITDIVPYNYEITNLELNGEILEEFPNNILRKDGIELKWEIKNLKPKERIEIKYDLHPRISRTIIFLLESQLKIIKYHSNLKKLRLEGFYEAKLPFTNGFDVKLDGVIIEDVIPNSYLHFIQEPKKLLPVKIMGFEFGELFRWDIGIMSDETLKFTYKLIDKHHFDDSKSEIDKLNNDGLESLHKGNIIDALDKYKQIRDEILNKIK